MKWIFAEFLSLLIFCHVFAAPSSKLTERQTDPLEEELIRHHHAVTEDKTSPNTNNADNYTPPDRSFESMSRDPNIQPIDENELYDITVGDVIRDVLLTLRDNPDIVKELIASEKAKLAEQIDAYNKEIDMNNDNEQLSHDRILPSQEQNNAEQRADDHSAGLSQTEDKSLNNAKRADEVSNDMFTGEETSDDSNKFMQFMDRPVEGGQNIPMFNYDKVTVDGMPESNKEDTEPRDTDTEPRDTESENVNDRKFQLPYQFPFMNQLQAFRNFGSLNAASTNERTPDSHDNNESRDSEGANGFNNEEELSWLLHEGRTNAANKQSENKNDKNPQQN